MNPSFKFYGDRIKAAIRDRARLIYGQALAFDRVFMRKELTGALPQTQETAALQLLEDLGLLRVRRGNADNVNRYRVDKIVPVATCLEQAMAETPAAKGMVVK